MFAAESDFNNCIVSFSWLQDCIFNFLPLEHCSITELCNQLHVRFSWPTQVSAVNDNNASCNGNNNSSSSNNESDDVNESTNHVCNESRNDFYENDFDIINNNHNTSTVTIDHINNTVVVIKSIIIINGIIGFSNNYDIARYVIDRQHCVACRVNDYANKHD
jgi:hypothetical protein